MKKWGFAAVLLCLNYSQAISSDSTDIISKKLPIKKIEIASPNAGLNKTLMDYLDKYENQILTQNLLFQINQDITDHLLSKKYRNSSVKPPVFKKEKDFVKIFFTIVHPYIYQLTVRGNENVSLMNIYGALKQDTLSHHSNFEQKIKTIITDHYKSLAYNRVQVKTLYKQTQETYKKQIQINIKENNRFTISKRSIVGSKKNSFYSNLWNTYASVNLKQGYYVEKDFKDTLRKIISHLRRSGYYFAKIYNEKIIFSGNKVSIEIIIDDGSPVVIDDIQISGHKNFSDSQIKNALSLKEGDLLDISKVEEELNKVIDFYQNQGFLEAKIKNKEEVIQLKEYPSKVAVIRINIDEGQKIYVKNLRVLGNKKVKDQFIIHASSLKEEELLTKKRIRQAYNSLQDLKLFSSIYIHPSSMIEVAEQNFRIFVIRGGLNTTKKLSARLVFEGSVHRFLGDDGSQLFLSADTQSNYRLLRYISTKTEGLSFPNYFEYNLSGSYKKQYLFGTRWNGLVSYSFSNTIFSFESKDPLPSSSSFFENYFKDEVSNVILERSQKIGLNLERKFDLQTFLNIKIFETDFIRSYPLVREHSNKKYSTGFLNEVGLSFFMDQRDDIFFPKTGMLLSYSVDYSGPVIGAINNIHYIRGEAKQNFYIPILKDYLFFAGSLSAGAMMNFLNSNIPVKYLFILGGRDSIRGFDGERDGERIPSKDEFAIVNATDMIQTSSFYYMTKSEIRFPLFIDNVGGSFFYDGGAVHIKGFKFKLTYRHTAGFSIYYTSVLGPIVVDIYRKLNVLPGESIYGYSLSMGLF